MTLVDKLTALCSHDDPRVRLMAAHSLSLVHSIAGLCDEREGDSEQTKRALLRLKLEALEIPERALAIVERQKRDAK